MTRELAVEVIRDPSHGFTGVPSQRAGSPAADEIVAELMVKLFRSGPGLSILAVTPGTPATGVTTWKEARLEVTAQELLDRADRLRTIWHDQVVEHRVSEAGHGLRVGDPLTKLADLTEHSTLVDPLVAKLADEGFDLLHLMLGGDGYDLGHVRDFLLGALSGEQELRVSFHSEWQLPWPMLAVDPAECDSPWQAFLGHRHQLEQADPRHSWDHAPLGRRERATTSLNKDTGLDHVSRAHEVEKLLEERSLLTVRTSGGELLEALSRSVLHEDVMYFWCHGRFVRTGEAGEFMAIQLSDTEDIDGPVVARKRRSYVRSPWARFKPFVLLNACQSGKAAAPGRLKHLGQELIDQGADGVLAPQIDMPEGFAAEYAYAFLERYLSSGHTAGEIGRFLVRRFAREFNNPLALAYSLKCGLNARLNLDS
ncbi:MULTISPECIES: hypothetical protein [unclassified Streptomyces]|uniref:hypothetical protein n=1 Tax=unclassified Streptomyces TaxID=2593676 RepID=UPI00224F9F87|nr:MULTISPECIES: hypothetical protein [unclassified Streptomyces]MCX5332348.1 hypothetical protein [Streptomyces sp. NBC_00140]MCX5361727.1 hypothetical protein [Streptomyces sp. NBC_00124]